MSKFVLAVALALIVATGFASSGSARTSGRQPLCNITATSTLVTLNCFRLDNGASYEASAEIVFDNGDPALNLGQGVQPVQNHEIHFFIGVTRSRSATLIWWLRDPGTPVNAKPPLIRGQYPVAFEHVSF